MIITIRSDNPLAEVGLYSETGDQLYYHVWQAHRELSSTILIVITDILKKQKVSFRAIEGLIFYAGPGSFTGLRIGAAVANAIARSMSIPSVCQTGDDWIAHGISRLKNGANEVIVPYYGNDARTTLPKK